MSCINLNCMYIFLCIVHFIVGLLKKKKKQHYDFRAWKSSGNFCGGCCVSIESNMLLANNGNSAVFVLGERVYLQSIETQIARLFLSHWTRVWAITVVFKTINSKNWYLYKMI